MASSDQVVILGAARTPIGRLGGTLSQIPSPKLGGVAIRYALDRASIQPDQVEYVIMGNVISAGVGQAPARQAALSAGLPETCPAMTVNKVCASSLMAVVMATQMIRAGDADVIVAGGMESMSQAPHVLKGSRQGKRLGSWELVDTLIGDGLWCCQSDLHMGSLAEGTSQEFQISREEQDRFALSSHQKAVKAQANGGFREEMAPVAVDSREGSIVITKDEGPRADATLEALAKLSPAFPPWKIVTPGNASQISDGAAALVVSSETRANALGLRPLAYIRDYAWVANEPSRLFEAPALAIDKLLKKSKRIITDFDLLEVNEAFAAQILANGKTLHWDWDRVNVKGGAIALGHPIGATGARILATLLYALKERGLSKGLAGLCHGGGGSVALSIELA